MLTLRAAAALLAADDADALARLAAACGCDGPPHPLAPRSRTRCLGLDILGGDASAVDVRVARGPGCLRALLIDLAPSTTCASFREVLPRLAARIARRTPHVGWLCIAASHTTGRPPRWVSWSADRHPPHVAALPLDRDDVVDSDAETLCALAAARAGTDDTLTHARWLAGTGRDAPTQRFYRALDWSRRAPRPHDDRTYRRRAALSTATGDRRTGVHVPAPVPRLSRSQGLARQRPELPHTHLHRMRRRRRPIPRARPAAALRDAEHAGRPASATRESLRPDSISSTADCLHPPSWNNARTRNSPTKPWARSSATFDRYRFTAREDGRTWSEAAVDPGDARQSVRIADGATRAPGDRSVLHPAADGRERVAA